MELALYRTDLCAIIDPEDIDKILLHTNKWYISRKRGRIQSVIGYSKLLGRVLGLSYAILGKRDFLHIDHINRNPLDNRKNNLRYVTITENNRNKGLTKGKSTKGIYMYGKGKWGVRINFTKNRKRKIYNKAGFASKEEAIAHSNLKYRELHGEFCFTNNIETKG